MLSGQGRTTTVVQAMKLGASDFVSKPFDEIVRTAKTFNADLIIIGTHGRTGFKRAFLGSTAERVVQHAHCPVLVVRQKEDDFVQRDQPSTKKELL